MHIRRSNLRQITELYSIILNSINLCHITRAHSEKMKVKKL